MQKQTGQVCISHRQMQTNIYWIFNAIIVFFLHKKYSSHTENTQKVIYGL